MNIIARKVKLIAEKVKKTSHVGQGASISSAAESEPYQQFARFQKVKNGKK